MSLQAWYVFNNNFQNYGVGDADLTQSVAPTFSANGKVSQYSFQSGQLKWTAEQTAKILNNTAVSIAFWIYPNLDTGTTYSGGIFGNDTMSSLGGRQYSVYQYPTCNDLHLSWQNYNNSSYSSVLATVVTGVLPSKQWTHVCITYQNPRVVVYINGIQNTTFNANMNTSSYSYATDVIKGSESKRFINDLRIYDHCLSAKEVKEISKGLILHMPLDNNGAGNENLLIESLKDRNQTHATYDICDFNFSKALVTNKTYTVSCKINMSPERKSIGLHHSGGSYNMGPWLAKNDTGFYRWTFTATSQMASQTAGNGYGFASVYVSNVNGPQGSVALTGTANVDWIKIEEGDVATPWCPNTADALYSSLGFNSSTVYDTSGYGNNGTMSSTKPTTVSDAPRYSSSMLFANGTYISTTLPSVTGFANSYTFSWWGKCTAYEGKMYWGFSGGNRLNLYGTGGVYCWNTGDGANNKFGTVAIAGQADNNWHHFAVTGDGTTTKLYIDGIFKANATTYKGITGNTLIFNGWDTGNSYNFNGQLSDFRLYATCLSAADIEELYKVPISIDNTGKVHAIEFNEV